MKIAFAASECVPFAKTGGLADVIGALPKALAAGKKGTADAVAVFLPRYSQIDEKKFPMTRVPGKIHVPMSGGVEDGIVWKYDPRKAKGAKDDSNVAFYFLENKQFFHRAGFYGAAGKDYADNDSRFAFYSRGVLEACKLIGFLPDVIHAHDWQAGLVPAFLKSTYRFDSFFHRTATVFTIHNIAYQGVFPKESLEPLGLSWSEFTMDKLEFFDQINFLKAGINYSDKISTVSPTYRDEVQSSHTAGRGMEGTLRTRAKDFEGILNGLDYGAWDPAKDPHLAAPFSAKSKTLALAKKSNREALMKKARFPQAPSAIVIGMVSRLDPQKGFRQVLDIVPQIAEKRRDVRWVILGSGDKEIHDRLSAISKVFPSQVYFDSTFNEPFAHQIYAGSDLFFMPSEFEPCGLSQMIAMRYASIPVVTPAGGLKDTVVDWNPARARGNGFVSQDFSIEALLATLQRALSVVGDPAKSKKLIQNAMSCEFSWRRAAEEYRALYRLRPASSGEIAVGALRGEMKKLHVFPSVE